MSESLKLTVELLEEHLNNYGHLTNPIALSYLHEQIDGFKEEIMKMERNISSESESSLLENMGKIMNEFDSLKILIEF